MVLIASRGELPASYHLQADKDPKLRKLVEDAASGKDKSAAHRLQQAFADQFMGGAGRRVMLMTWSALGKLPVFIPSSESTRGDA